MDGDGVSITASEPESEGGVPKVWEFEKAPGYKRFEQIAKTAKKRWLLSDEAMSEALRAIIGPTGIPTWTRQRDLGESRGQVVMCCFMHSMTFGSMGGVTCCAVSRSC
jgi:hypothetical protein